MMNNDKTQNKLLHLNNINKSFFGTQVLKDVDFEMDCGQVVSIIGTNGAGKSTLSNIIAGIYSKDSGDILFNGKNVCFDSPKDAEEIGISMVHQEPTLCENMTVYENIFLNREILNPGSRTTMDREKMREESRRVLEYLGFEINVDELVENLPLVSKGIVSIAKAMLINPKVLILDEVTAPLNQKEVEHLFGVIDSLRDKGLAIIYISHKIKEIVQISDEVVVLKDGENVGTFCAKDAALNEKDIIHLMLGETEEWQGEYIEKQLTSHDQESLLHLENVTKKGLYEDISFDLHHNEIIGLAGLKGSGISELMLSLFGVIHYDAGNVSMNGKPYKAKNPKDAIKKGVSMVTNDRQKEGLALILSIQDNVTIASMGKLKGVNPYISQKKMAELTKNYIRSLCVVCTDSKQQVQFLSGGNQQKVVISKYLLANTDVLLVDEPTRGIDVKAKNDIYDLMIRQKKEGKGIVVFSPEVRELLNICNRILIMHRGKITAEVKRDDSNFNEKGILEAMHSF